MGLWDAFSGIGQSAQGAGNSIGGFLGHLLGGGGQGGIQGAGQAGNTTQRTGQSMGMGGGGNFLSGLFGGGQGGQGGMNPGMMGLGLGAMGLGQMMNKPMQVPNYGSDPNVQALQNWQNQPNHPMDPNVRQSVQNSLNQQNEISRRNLMNVYKNMRPGYSPTDSDFTRDTAYNERNIQMNNADAMAGAQFQSNNQQLGNLGNLANLGVGGQMQQLAMDAARRQSQNQMYGNIGSMFLQRGLGMPNYMGMFNPNYSSMGGQGR